MDLVLPLLFPHVMMHINDPSKTITITQVHMVDQTELCIDNKGKI